ncbi:MAG: hypothetical protein ACLFVT_05850 [Syntrophobacteria bacterium]
MAVRKFQIWLPLLIFCVLTFSCLALAAENNSYRAGYVMGYQEQETARTFDPDLSYGRYAKQRREVLKQEGHVPISFYRGLRDGFRDSVREYTPEYTIEDVHLERLPEHLHPGE